MNTNAKSLIFWMVVAAVAVFLFATVRTSPPPLPKVMYSQFLREVEAGNVTAVAIRGGSNASPTVVSMKDGRSLRTVLPADYGDALSAMQTKGVSIEIEDSASGNWISLLVNASPFLVLLAFWIFMMRRMQRGPAAPIV